MESSIGILLKKAIAFQQAGHVDEARVAYASLLAREPQNTQCLVLLGRLEREQGRFNEARDLLLKAATTAPAAPAVFSELGHLAVEVGDSGAAVRYFQRLTELIPDSSLAFYELGLAQRAAEMLEACIASLRIALRLGHEPERNAYCQIAGVFVQSGDPDAAVRELDLVLTDNPDDAEANFLMASALMAKGQFAEALGLTRRVIDLEPDYAAAYQLLANVQKFSDANDPDITRIKMRLDNADACKPLGQKLHFALGKAYDDCGLFDEAFEHYEKANTIGGELNLRYDRALMSDFTRRIINAYPSPVFADATAVATGSPQPIFVVGMPRSGTTLVEQILTSHSNVSGAGEQSYISNLSRTHLNGFPDRYSIPESGMCLEIANDYRRLLQSFGKDTDYVTDKHTVNFFYLGLIRVLLPDAILVHCGRHPLDVCLSIFFQDHGPGMPFAWDLEDTAAYYLEYDRIMQHWKSVFRDSIFELQYEELTTDPERVILALLDHCGLPWEHSCLDHASNPRPIATLSTWQARQPIYARSRHRFNNYESHLGKLKNALGID